MGERRSDHDVTDRVKVTDPGVVRDEIQRIYQDLYQSEPAEVLTRSFNDAARFFRGDQPGYLPCDTGYHNIQHTLDVTLAMARLMDGYERFRNGRELLGRELYKLGIITALFHDIGYIREQNDAARNGAEYTRIHVSRGASFLEEYLPKIGLPQMAPVAAKLIHFTGYEIPVDQIEVPAPIYRLLGNLLGSADIVAQMADRCYLEKCRDLLYPEFVVGDIVRRRTPDGGYEVMFNSAQDLVFKTPAFYQGAIKRLNEHLSGVYRCAEKHFGGQNLYLEELNKNIRYAERVAKEQDISLLRRTLPQPEPEKAEAKP
ncbi:MAG: HD domain-containing protein [Betaproteobacteria bacterium]|nr:HD domain-containing protein [Betaproteobacteria bacterium]